MIRALGDAKGYPVRSIMAPIPITYIIAAISTGQAGTEGHLLRLIRGLDRAQFTPRLIVLQESEWTRSFSDPTIPLTVLGFRSFKILRDWQCVWRLAQILRTTGAQIVELYYTDAHFIGSLAARLARIPVVISCRRNMAYQYGRKERLLSRFANRFVHCFLANSIEVVRHIARVEDVRESRFRVIENGVDLAAFDKAKAQPLPDNIQAAIAGRLVIVISANLRPVKNIQLLLTALYYLRSDFPTALVVSLGAGSEAEALRYYAEESELTENVIWVGAVADTAPYLAAAHVGVLSSNSEGFSNAIVEYMAAGLPVIATQVGGAAEAVVPAETGYLIPVGDYGALTARLSELFLDMERAAAMGDAGRERVQAFFTFERQMARYQALYHLLLSEAHP